MRIPIFLHLLLLLTSCVSPGRLSKLPKDIHIVEKREAIKEYKTGNQTLTIQYLGAGGLYLLNKNEGILIDPFFSNQKVGKLGWSVLFGKENIRANKKMVTYGLKSIEAQTGPLAPQVKAIFSAHSHYDHLLDVPAVFASLNKPMVYLNQTGYNICYSVIDKNKMDVLGAHMTTAEKTRPPITWATDSTSVNVYPILADHNPHLKNIKAFDGDITTPNQTFTNPYDKTTANTWLEGNTFAFVIDYVTNNKITLRLYIQSSSCSPPGLSVRNEVKAEALAKEGNYFSFLDSLPPHNIDIAFLGIASYAASPQYPAELLRALNPAAVVWLHWEDFFRRYTRPPKTVRATNVPAFFKLDAVNKVKDNAYLPWPRAVLEVKY
jgi:L-ascorbate metabolism protein UlaG (beta-lactamase superfamily)